MGRELNNEQTVMPYHTNDSKQTNQVTNKPTIIINRLLIIMTITIVVITTAATATATVAAIHCCSLLS